MCRHSQTVLWNICWWTFTFKIVIIFTRYNTWHTQRIKKRNLYVWKLGISCLFWWFLIRQEHVKKSTLQKKDLLPSIDSLDFRVPLVNALCTYTNNISSRNNAAVLTLSILFMLIPNKAYSILNGVFKLIYTKKS